MYILFLSTVGVGNWILTPVINQHSSVERERGLLHELGSALGRGRDLMGGNRFPKGNANPQYYKFEK